MSVQGHAPSRRRHLAHPRLSPLHVHPHRARACAHPLHAISPTHPRLTPSLTQLRPSHPPRHPPVTPACKHTHVRIPFMPSCLPILASHPSCVHNGAISPQTAVLPSRPRPWSPCHPLKLHECMSTHPSSPSRWQLSPTLACPPLWSAHMRVSPSHNLTHPPSPHPHSPAIVRLTHPTTLLLHQRASMLMHPSLLCRLTCPPSPLTPCASTMALLE
jgi:hypothetical protein